MSRLPITLIAAIPKNDVIGRDGGMPWRLPGDLAHFRRATWGKPVIMGRRTFDSIGRPLPGRFTVVVSRRTDPPHPGVTLAASPEDAVELADAIGRREKADSIMVAGGASIYAALMPVATTMLVTSIDMKPDGDTFFPLEGRDRWVVADATPLQRGPGDEAAYVFARWIRKA